MNTKVRHIGIFISSLMAISGILIYISAILMEYWEHLIAYAANWPYGTAISLIVVGFIMSLIFIPNEDLSDAD